MIFRTAGFNELDVTTLYALLKLRVDVFVVEQKCPYPELDDRDIESTTRHLWFEVGRVPVAYLRILSDPDPVSETGGGTGGETSGGTGNGPVAHIGRVVTAPAARGEGLAGQLITAAVAAIGDQPAVLNAQTPLVGFYTKYGFKPSGPEFIEDGIPHVPMRRG